MQIIKNIGAFWGVSGVVAMLCYAIARLLPNALESLQSELSLTQWFVLLVWCIYMLITEGYQGFQKQLSPRIVARAQYIQKHGNLTIVLLAPLFCLSYFYATKKRLIVSYGLTLAIILFVVVARQLPAPWRGIVDAGVVLGLGYGVVWIIIYAAKAKNNVTYVTDPEIQK